MAETVRVGVEVKGSGLKVLDQTGQKLNQLATQTQKAQAATGKATKSMGQLTGASFRLSGGALRTAGSLKQLASGTGNLTAVVGSLTANVAEAIPNLETLEISAAGVKSAITAVATSAAVATTAIVALGASLAAAAKYTIDYVEEQNALADAEARSREVTTHQFQQYKKLAEALGSTTAELQSQGITLQEIIKRAKSGNQAWSEYAKALETVTRETVASNAQMKAQAEALVNVKTGAQQVAEVFAKQEEAAQAAGSALIKQAGIVDWNEFGAQVAGVEKALEELEGRGYSAEKAQSLLNKQMMSLVETGRELGFTVPEAWEKIYDEQNKANDETDRGTLLAGQYAKASENGLRLSEQAAERAAAKMAMLQEWAGRFRSELDAISKASSSVTIGGGVTRDFDMSDPAVMGAVERLERRRGGR